MKYSGLVFLAMLALFAIGVYASRTQQVVIGLILIGVGVVATLR